MRERVRFQIVTNPNPGSCPPTSSFADGVFILADLALSDVALTNVLQSNLRISPQETISPSSPLSRPSSTTAHDGHFGGCAQQRSPKVQDDHSSKSETRLTIDGIPHDVRLIRKTAYTISGCPWHCSRPDHSAYTDINYQVKTLKNKKKFIKYVAPKKKPSQQLRITKDKAELRKDEDKAPDPPLEPRPIDASRLKKH